MAVVATGFSRRRRKGTAMNVDPLAHLRPPGPPAPLWLYVFAGVAVLVAVLMAIYS